MRCGAGTRACRVGTHADACLRHCVTTANRCRDEARHGRHECLRHIGWVECEKCGLTKRALVGGDTEKVALQWANEQVWAGCTGQIAGQERSRFPQYWPFPASPCRRAVNQKGREFVAGSFGSANMAEFELLS